MSSCWYPLIAVRGVLRSWDKSAIISFCSFSLRTVSSLSFSSLFRHRLIFPARLVSPESINSRLIGCLVFSFLRFSSWRFILLTCFRSKITYPTRITITADNIRTICTSPVCLFDLGSPENEHGRQDHQNGKTDSGSDTLQKHFRFCVHRKPG